MSGVLADGTGYRVARTIRAHFKTVPWLTLIDSFAEPEARGDVAVTAAGAITPEEYETATPGLSFVLVEEQAGVRFGVAEGDDDEGALALVAVAREVRKACLKAGYSDNLSFEWDALAQTQSGKDLTYIAGFTVTAQASADMT